MQTVQRIIGVIGAFGVYLNAQTIKTAQHSIYNNGEKITSKHAFYC